MEKQDELMNVKDILSLKNENGETIEYMLTCAFKGFPEDIQQLTQKNVLQFKSNGETVGDMFA